jgi:HEAT repeat protein
MKMNVLRHLVLPWFLLFLFTVAAIVVLGVDFNLEAKHHEYYFGALGLGIFLCLVANFRTLSKAGIWIAHSLPSSLRRSPWGWIFRAVLAAGVAFGFYMIGQLPWIPLIWQAAVIPGVFTIALFVGIWSLMGPILTWCSQIAFSRFSAFILSLPVFVLVPVTAVFLGQMILTAYRDSRPESFLTRAAELSPSGPATVAEPVATAAPSAKDLEVPASSETAQEFQAMATAGKSCADSTKEISAALTSNGPEDVVYWAIRAVKCTDMKSVIGMTKLAKIMMDHSSGKVRAAAIRAMPRFGHEDVRRVGYLLVKRIGEKEPPEVIEAAASVLARLGVEETKWATKRLTALLDTSKTSGIAAKVLVHDLKRDDLVAEYVSQHLTEEGPGRARAITMICSLPVASRAVAVPAISHVVASIKTGDDDDPAIDALECLGTAGFEAIRKEVLSPERLQKPLAARALAEISVKDNPEALETAKTCARDSNAEVRGWCSQTLGRIGAPALPQILDLLKSSDRDLKASGNNALNFFDDPVAKNELVRVRAENSGWMANKQKLQVAKAVDKALIKIITDENQKASAESESKVKE